MWYISAASTFSIQDDVAVEFRSHQSKMHKMPLASPPHRRKQQQHFCCRGPTQRQTWRRELICTCASSSFSSNSRLQFVPDFRGKGKKTGGPSIWCWLTVFYVTSMRRWCYILAVSRARFPLFPKRWHARNHIVLIDFLFIFMWNRNKSCFAHNSPAAANWY